jgi:acetyl esterase/lipase
VLDLDNLDLGDIADALADQFGGYEHLMLIDPRTGETVYWSADTGIDGNTPVDLDELLEERELVGIRPLPSWVWYQDMADFADGISDDQAGRRLERAIRGKGAAMASAGAQRPEPAKRGDWQALRANGEASLALAEATLPEQPGVSRTDYATRSRDGAEVALRWYSPADRNPGEPGSAVVYLHGGGMIMGTVALYDRFVAAYAADSGVPVLAVDYRRAPEHPHPAPVEDAYAGLAWLAAQSGELGVDPQRIALMGDSGGGGIAAGTALLARERGAAVARQILIYPMLDDRTLVPDPALVPFAGWSYDDNYTGWHALLGDKAGADDVPETAAPARAASLAGLPAAYVEVGELDIFRDESIEYARWLAAAGTSVELHVRPGCPHGFDRMPADLDVVRRSHADRLRVLRSI